MIDKEAYPAHPVYDKNTIEFVTVAAEYCAFIEGCKHYSPKSFFDKSVKLLSLLYLKASLVPEMEETSFSELQRYVTEASYEIQRRNVGMLTDQYDEYIEVKQEEDGQYTDEYVAYISEDLADVYQDLKDMIANFQSADINIMNDALSDCMDNFKSFWGLRLLNALRAMHNVLCKGELTDVDNDRSAGAGYDEIEERSNGTDLEIDFFND